MMDRYRGGQVRILQSLMVYGVLLLLSIPGPAYAADAARGAIIARVRCAPCHFLNRHEHKLGPGLDGIYDRAPSINGVPFKRWDAHALDVWLSGPRKVKLNTTMVLPPLPPSDRADVIAYFKQQKQRLMASGGSVASPGSP
jgi:cytochrome c